MPSVKALEEKKKVVNEIKDKLNNSKSIVLFNYRGLTDNESKELRAKLKDNNSDYKIYKNTLLKLALNDENINLDSYLEGPTAIAFSSDDIAAIKVLSDYAKGHKVLELKAGMVEGSTCDTAKIKEFASIPGRDGLYAMLSCGMIAIVKDLSIALNLLAEQKKN